MNEIPRIENICDYNSIMGLETLHPLVSVIDMSQVKKDVTYAS